MTKTKNNNINNNDSNDCSKNNNTSSSSSSSAELITSKGVKKRSRRSVPRESPSQRSSIYRGVTRHRWTGRYEAHLWDKNCWNESQNKKGRQVYLGAYDDEEAAAHAYDLAALKYWGHETILNFPISTYENELKDMEGQSKEEYIGSLRRKSSGFSRGVSKYRGVARHHHNGRWEARIGRVFGNKYLYLGTYATQEEAATAYDMAAIEYRGPNAVTNFDLSRYIKLLRPNNGAVASPASPSCSTGDLLPSIQDHVQSSSNDAPVNQPATSSALGLLLQSTKIKEMLGEAEEGDSVVVGPTSPPESDSRQLQRCSFPEDIQTYFEDDGMFGEGDENIFGDISMAFFDCELLDA